ncbi:MAG TPA: glycerophosphodiester phosphodiesterase [Gaiellaceae bacterium]|jgi:glycerophosphoryl diester phosphodiesterase|nr:glycerophosphodiester phosphodiesterase [Gaiellaceae bacterium]
MPHPDGRPAVIGHRGAAAVARENTLEALEAGIAAGAELVEFDLDDGLVLGHPGVERPDPPPTLEDALAYIASTPAGAHVDLKFEGAEAEVAAALRRHGLAERSLVSSASAASLRRLAGEAPELGRALGYPQDRHGVSRFAWPKPVVAASIRAVGPVLRLRLPPLLRSARADILSLHQSLVTSALVRDLHRRDATVIAWTVNDPDQVRRLTALQVDGIVTDDPGMVMRVLATLTMP